jgi:uncharacterized protein YecE (DUF72 family)
MARSKNPDVELFVGTSGYSYPDWKGIVYPPSLKREVGGTTPELTYMSRYFNTCEINATYYRQFEPEIAKRWSDAVENPSFEFAIKANQVFTHAAERSQGSERHRLQWRVCTTRKPTSTTAGASWTYSQNGIGFWSSSSNSQFRSGS